MNKKGNYIMETASVRVQRNQLHKIKIKTCQKTRKKNQNLRQTSVLQQTHENFPSITNLAFNSSPTIFLSVHQKSISPHVYLPAVRKAGHPHVLGISDVPVTFKHRAI